MPPDLRFRFVAIRRGPARAAFGTQTSRKPISPERGDTVGRGGDSPRDSRCYQAVLGDCHETSGAVCVGSNPAEGAAGNGV